MNGPDFEYPMALEPHIEMDEPHAPIIIYSGEYSLQSGERIVNLNGTIQYSWSQQCRIIFEGTCSYPLGLAEKGDIYIHNHKCAEGYITRQSFSSSEPASLRGTISELTFGDSTEMCDKVCFALINLDSFFGEILQRENKYTRDRLTFNKGGYSIIIENRENLKNVASKFGKVQGGYYISHYCQITKQYGQISLKEADEILTGFAMYFSFVFGKRYMPFFIYGYKDNKKICEYHSAERLPSEKGAFCWVPTFGLDEIKLLWNNFYDLWQHDKDHRDILTTAIHWYIEANTNSGALEGAYIMAFAGIELMYNVLIGKKIKGSTEKINTLTRLLNIDATINAKELCDMRNVLVHYGQQNRAIYSEISNQEKFNRLTRVIYILELSIMKYLDYQGHYVNRLNNEKRQEVEVVPYHN